MSSPTDSHDMTLKGKENIQSLNEEEHRIILLILILKVSHRLI